MAIKSKLLYKHTIYFWLKQSLAPVYTDITAEFTCSLLWIWLFLNVRKEDKVVVMPFVVYKVPAGTETPTKKQIERNKFKRKQHQFYHRLGRTPFYCHNFQGIIQRNLKERDLEYFCRANKREIYCPLESAHTMATTFKTWIKLDNFHIAYNKVDKIH